MFIDAGDSDDSVTLPLTGEGWRGYARGGEGADVLTGAGFLAGGPGNDLLLGDDGDNVLEGDGGDDRIDARGGNDVLHGDLISTNDYEFGLGYHGPDPGADTLRGGEGDDTLDAGSERGDVLSGGPGADTLQDWSRRATLAAKVRCGSGRDAIELTPQGQLLTDCEQLRFDGGKESIALRPWLLGGGRPRFSWTGDGDDVRRIGIAVGVRAG